MLVIFISDLSLILKGFRNVSNIRQRISDQQHVAVTTASITPLSNITQSKKIHFSAARWRVRRSFKTKKRDGKHRGVSQTRSERQNNVTSQSGKQPSGEVSSDRNAVRRSPDTIKANYIVENRPKEEVLREKNMTAAFFLSLSHGYI